MKFSPACVSSLLAPFLVTAKSLVANGLEVRSEPNKIRNMDGDTKKNEEAMASHPTTESFFSLEVHMDSDVKDNNKEEGEEAAYHPTTESAFSLEVHSEPNRIRNVDSDIKDNNKKDEEAAASHPTTKSTYSFSRGGKEECFPPVTLGKTRKVDAGSLPLSSCSSSRKQICNNKDMSQSSSSIEKESGVCTDINDIPPAYWASSDPSASSDIPASYWEDTVTSTAARDERRFLNPTQATDCKETCPDEDRPDVSTYWGTFYELILYRNDYSHGTINCWDTSKITEMDQAFYAQWNFDEAIECWDTSKVTSMDKMFYYAGNFNQSVGAWDTSKVTSMDKMFHHAGNFNQSVGAWDTSKVTSMDKMFGYARNFDQSVGAWDTSKVTSMDKMFGYAYDFDQSVGAWDTSKVTSMDKMFGYAFYFDQSVGAWDVSQVKNMHRMFADAFSFNQLIDSWDVSQVEVMSGMFLFALSFNKPLDSWNVSTVDDMDEMFADAFSFNQCLSTWAEKTPDNVETNSMFLSSNCPERNRPDSRIGPWCQNFEQGCFAPGKEPSASPSPSSAPTFDSVSHDLCENFAVHARTTVTFDGVASTVHFGDVGVYPGTSITGDFEFNNGGNATGAFQFEIGEVVVDSQDFADHVVEAHATAMEHHSGEQTMEIEIGGITFTPGIYRSDSAINFAHGTVVTLDGGNETNPEFLFIAGSTLVTAADTYFDLKNGAKAENVVWALGTAATLGARSHVAGSIMAGTAITFGTRSELHGCALAQSAVTFESEGSVVLN